MNEWKKSLLSLLFTRRDIWSKRTLWVLSVDFLWLQDVWVEVFLWFTVQCKEKIILDTQTVLDVLIKKHFTMQKPLPPGTANCLRNCDSLTAVNSLHHESCSMAGHRVYLNELPICRKALLELKPECFIFTAAKVWDFFSPFRIADAAYTCK